MQKDDLGLMMQVGVVAVAACPPSDVMSSILQGLVKHIGMTTGGLQPAIWHYPFQDMGGEVETSAIPFLIGQPLMESFSLGAAVGDSWYEHGGSYIIVASCRPFSMVDISEYLNDNMGKVVDCSPPIAVRLKPEEVA